MERAPNYLGMLSNLLGRTDDADVYLALALSIHDGLRSETLRLWTEVEQARTGEPRTACRIRGGRASSGRAGAFAGSVEACSDDGGAGS